MVRVTSGRDGRRGRRCASGGRHALASKGPGGARRKLDPQQLRLLETVLHADPAVFGGPDRAGAMLRTCGSAP